MKTNKIHDVYIAFWKIKFGQKKINLFKDVCMLRESVNKSFLLTLSSYRVLWLWWQRVPLMKESLSGFSFECDSRPSEVRSWTLVEEGKEFVGQSIGYCITGLVACCLVFVLVFVCVYGSQTLCYLYPTGGSKSRPKFWRGDIYWPIRFVFYYFIFEPKYFLLVHFRSYFSRMFYSMFLADWLKNIKM